MMERGRPGVLMVVVLLGVGFLAGRVTSDGDDDETGLGLGPPFSSPGLSASATGRVTAKPEHVIARFAVEASGGSVEALRQGNERTTQLVEALRAKGVDADDIQTEAARFGEGFAGPPVFEEPSDGASFEVSSGSGSRVSGSLGVEVRIRDVGAALSTIDAALGVEGVSLNRVALALDDGGKAMAAATSRAVRDARGQAEHLARAAGRELGKAISITKDASPYSAYEFPEEGRDEGLGPPFDDRERSFEVDVVVTYELD